MRKILFLAWMLLLVLLGCAPAHSVDDGKGLRARIIIKFSDTAARPAERTHVDALSQHAGVTLRYMQPISDSLHVFEVLGLRDPAELQEIMRRLAKHPGVTYVEEDRPRRVQ